MTPEERLAAVLEQISPGSHCDCCDAVYELLTGEAVRYPEPAPSLASRTMRVRRIDACPCEEDPA